jgi:hypothetical protein
MKAWLWTELLILGVLGVGLAIMGCSGAGAPAVQVRGASVQTLAQDNLSAVLLVRSWFNMLHTKAPGLGASAVRPCAVCTPVDNTEHLPDGSARSRGTWSDCGEYDYTQGADGSGQGSAHWPDGRRQDISWSAPTYVGAVYHGTLDERFGDGTHFVFEMTIDFGQYPAPQTWAGTGTLADGRTMNFVLARRAGAETPGEDHITLSLPDGSSLDVRVPLTSVVGALFWPMFDRGARGTFTDPGGATIRFVMTGDKATDRWTRWALTAPDGTTGAFTFTDGLSASGQLYRGGKVVGALRWDTAVQGTLDLLDTAAQDIGPSKAARDFEMGRWFSNAAAMGPAPMY